MNINLGVDHIYVINLERHKKRKLRMIKQFDKLGIQNYEFITAIDGKEEKFSIPQLIKDGILNKFFIDPVGCFTYNIIACALSHRKAIGTFLKSSHNTCLILEDDVVFDPYFFEYSLIGGFDLFKKQIKDSKADIVIWGKQKTFEIRGIQTKYSELLCKSYKNPWSAHAYQINKQSASKMFEQYLPLKYAADTYLDFGGFHTLTSKYSILQQSQGTYDQTIIEGLYESIHHMNCTHGDFDSATQPDRFLGLQYFWTDPDMPIDYITRRTIKTPGGSPIRDCSVIYFKTDESSTRKLD